MALFTRRLPSLLRVPASPVPRSRQYYEGATTSHSRINGRLLVRFRRPRGPSCFVSRLRAPASAEVPCRPGPCCCRLPGSGFSHVDANGISQVFRRSVRCLCSVPRPRPGRDVLAIDGHLSAALATHIAKAPATFISGLTRSFGTCCLRFTHGVAARVQGSLPADGLRLCREGVEPSGSLRKVSVRFDDHPPFLLS
jgi:hypothetical protein